MMVVQFFGRVHDEWQRRTFTANRTENSWSRIIASYLFYTFSILSDFNTSLSCSLRTNTAGIWVHKFRHRCVQTFQCETSFSGIQPINVGVLSKVLNRALVRTTYLLDATYEVRCTYTWFENESRCYVQSLSHKIRNAAEQLEHFENAIRTQRRRRARPAREASTH